MHAHSVNSHPYHLLYASQLFAGACGAGAWAGTAATHFAQIALQADLESRSVSRIEKLDGRRLYGFQRPRKLGTGPERPGDAVNQSANRGPRLPFHPPVNRGYILGFPLNCNILIKLAANKT